MRKRPDLRPHDLIGVHQGARLRATIDDPVLDKMFLSRVVAAEALELHVGPHLLVEGCRRTHRCSPVCVISSALQVHVTEALLPKGVHGSVADINHVKIVPPASDVPISAGHRAQRGP